MLIDNPHNHYKTNMTLISLFGFLFLLLAATFYGISNSSRYDSAYNSYINILSKQNLSINSYVHLLKIGMVDYQYAPIDTMFLMQDDIDYRYRFFTNRDSSHCANAEFSELCNINNEYMGRIFAIIKQSKDEWKKLLDNIPVGEIKLNDKFVIVDEGVEKTVSLLNQASQLIQNKIYETRIVHKYIQTGILMLALVIFLLTIFFMQRQIFIPMREMLIQLKKSHQNIEISRTFMKTIIDNIADPIFVKNEKHEWIMGNKAFWKLMNGNEADFLGKSDYDVFSKEQADAFWAKDDEVLENKKTITNEEYLTRPTGEALLINTKKTPFILPNGSVGLVGIIHDVTKERAMEKEIIDHRDNLQNKVDEQTRDLISALQKSEEAARVKGEFLANMSHEIRTPLNGVIGMADLVLDMDLNDEERRLIEVIRTSGTTLLRIINDILDVSKIDAGKLTLEGNDFNLYEAIEDVVDLMTFRAIDQQIQILLNMPLSVPEYVYGDVGRIKQILVNLMGNAIKFTKHGHVILRIKAKKNKDGVYNIKFDIEDTGIGIENDKLEHIFDKFTQADRTTTRMFGGTGLGLSICKSLIEMMDGSISVKSKVGKGSVFSFNIKLPQAKTIQVEQNISSVNLRELNVLVVEDTDVNQIVISNQLKEWEIRHELAENAETAYKFLTDAVEKNQTPFDIALIDQHLSDLTGIELANKIRANPQLSKLGMVMFSSFSSGQVVSDKQIKEAGFLARLTKPTNPIRLKNVLIYTKDAVNNNNTSFYMTRHISLSKEEQYNSSKKQTATIDKEQNAKLRILVADDMKINIMLVTRILGEMGFQIDVADTGKKALEMHLLNPYNLIFMDCHMPEMNGYDASMAIRNHEKENNLPQVPIIALTADAMKENQDKCREYGMSDYITKPIQKLLLIEVTQSWLQNVLNSNKKS